MFDINFDVSELNKFAKSIKRRKQELEKGRQEWLNFIDKQIHISGRLKYYIDQLVYSDGKDNQWYERTGDLKKAVRLDTTKDSVYAYIDDEWLGSRPQANQKSASTGFDDSSHQGHGYGWNVEQGHYYINRSDGVPAIKDYYTIPRPFTQKTYEDIKRMMDTGQTKQELIIDALIRNWGR